MILVGLPRFATSLLLTMAVLSSFSDGALRPELTTTPSVPFVHADLDLTVGTPQPVVDPVPPSCHGDGPAAEAIYAVPNGAADRFPGIVSTIRSAIETANGHLWQAGYDTGRITKLKVLCSDGEPVVYHEIVQTTPAGDATHSLLKAELTTRGYASIDRKYWVFYDAQVQGLCGQGDFITDSVKGAANPSNQGPSFAIIYGDACFKNGRTPVHELSHTMGAIQPDAPQSSGGAHCIDGYDIMCAGPPQPDPLADQWHVVCGSIILDCNKDSYFDVQPEDGSYLDMFWNMAGDYNRFLEFGQRSIEFLDCPPSVDIDAEMQCSVRAGGDGNVRYDIQWGDGATEETGLFPADFTLPIFHTYTQSGVFQVFVTATSNDGEQYLPKAEYVTVNPHDVNLQCPDSVVIFAAFSCDFQAEGNKDVYYDVTWGDGSSTRVPEEGYFPTFVSLSASHSYGATGTYTITVIATDTDGRQTSPATHAIRVDPDVIPPEVHVYDPVAGRLYQGLHGEFCDADAFVAVPRVVFLNAGCYEVDAIDTGSGVAGVYANLISPDLLGLFNSYTVCCGHRNSDGLWIQQFTIPELMPLAQLHVVAYDRAGNRGEAVLDITGIPPV